MTVKVRNEGTGVETALVSNDVPERTQLRHWC
jgi:hypothetical protein